MDAMGTIEGSYFGNVTTKINEKYYKTQLWNLRQYFDLPTFRFEGGQNREGRPVVTITRRIIKPFTYKCMAFLFISF